MFDKFGEFNTAEEINASAEGLKEEGDKESLFILAEENGLDKEDVEDYLDDAIPELTTPLLAALGKLKVEEQNLKPQHIMVDWVNYIKTQCAKSEELARAVRKKGKSLKGCMGEILKYSFGIRAAVDKDVVKAAGISASRVDLGIPNMVKVYELINTYYLGK